MASRERQRRNDLRSELERRVSAEGYKMGDIFPELGNGASGRQRRKMPAKFRNPQNPEETWTGIGRSPKWVQAILDQRGIDMATFEGIPMRDVPGGEVIFPAVWSGAGTKLFLRSTDSRTQELARGLAPTPPGVPNLLDVRPLSGLGPDECCLSAPDGRFERRHLLPGTQAPTEGDGPAPGSRVVALGLARSPDPVGEPT